MNPDPTPAAHLPAPLPSPAALLQRTQGALGLLREATLESSADYWYKKGKAAMKPGGLEEAKYSFGQCLAREPTHWRAALQLAILLSAQMSQESATMMGVALAPYYKGDIPWDLWEAYYGECPQTNRQVLQMGLELNIMSQKETPDALLLLSLVYEAGFDSEKAKAMLIEIEARHYNFFSKSFICQVHLGGLSQFTDPNRALENYNQAISMAPENGALHLARAGVKFTLKDYKGSLTDYNTCITLNHRLAWVYYERANLKHHRLSDYTGALNDYDASISLDSSNSSVYRERARLKRILGDIMGAELDIKKTKAIER